MNNSWKTLIAFVSFASPGLAFAATPQIGITYDCDTATSHFSELVLPAPDGPFIVSGHLQINQIPTFDKFAPVTRLGIAQASTPGANATDLAGFSLNAIFAKMIDPKTKDSKLVVQFADWDEVVGGTSKKHVPFGVSTMGEKLDFTLTYASGQVTARFAGQEQRIALNAPNPVVRVICSTGEFLFTDLKIEKAN